MKFKLTMASLLIALSGQVAAHAHKDHNESAMWDKYQNLAQKINASVQSASMSELAKDSAMLTKLSTKLLPAFVAKQPVCTEYINAAIAATDTMLNSSLDVIEKDYHADGKLPKIKAAVCYHAKDMLVHPATMAVIAKTEAGNEKAREMIAHELEEVLEHFNQVKQNAGI
ncbi:hypothetical protein ACFSJY_15700 [Thalassotalea euphylliae]|uniref:hypothetical protein n=1 Tax=Thalassotalea euphylliae TaxID=1655234 RepID=UPI0036374FF7